MRYVLPALILLSFLLAPPVAAANTYVVYSCKTRLGTPAPADGFSDSVTTGGASTFNDCAAGGPLGANLAGGSAFQHANSRATWHFAAPANTEIRQFDAWRSSRVLGHRLDGSQKEVVQYTSFPESGYLTNRAEWCGSTFCAGRGNDAAAIVPENLWYSGQLNGVRDVYFAVGCEGSDPCPSRGSATEPMASLRIHGVQWILTDEHNPVAAGPTGALVGAGPHKGVENANFDATDLGSGLFWTFVEIKPSGGAWEVAQRRIVDPNGGRCAELNGFADYPYEFGHTVPCRLSASIELPWDTTAKPDGDYELRIRLEDASGNSTVVLPAKPFEIDNVPPPAATAPPAIVGAAQLGSTLVGERGSWAGASITFADAWLRCTDRTDHASCTPIDGATGRQYGVADADLGRYLRFRVTATNAEGTHTEISAATARVTTSAGVVPQCADGIDNDQDGKIDTDDPACPARANDNEAADTTTQMPTPTAIPTASPLPSPTASATPAPPESRGEPNGTNASDRARLTVSGGNRRKLPYGRGATTTLTLRDENGRPISDATVQVLQRMSVPGARWVAAHSPLTTDGDGRIRYAIEPRFSRKLRFGYRSHRTDARFAATRGLTVTVSSRTTLRTSRSYLRNGHSVMFKGRLSSRPVPVRGVVIDLQAQVGRRWQTFQTLRTSSEGTWEARYRFRSTTGVQTYTFRARVRGDTGYPYAPSTSRRVKVRVRG